MHICKVFFGFALVSYYKNGNLMHNFLIKKKLFVCGTCDEKEMEAILRIISLIIVF